MGRSRPERVLGRLGSSRGFAARGAVATVLVLILAAVCVRLGFWQLDRLEQRRARNDALAGALAMPPLELEGDSLAAVLRDPESYQYRRVRVRGTYEPGADFVQRGRSLHGRPGVYLFSPLHVAGSRWAVMVNRGWAPSPDALSVDPRPLAEPGPRAVVGILEAYPAGVRETRPMERTVGDARMTVIQRLDADLLRERSPTPLAPTVYVQQLPGPDAPAGLERIPLPAMDEGPHLGYAVQWFSFATIALVGLLILLLRSRRPAR